MCAAFAGTNLPNGCFLRWQLDCCSEQRTNSNERDRSGLVHPIRNTRDYLRQAEVVKAAQLREQLPAQLLVQPPWVLRLWG